ncbi:MAG: hypothetical protein ACI8W7_001127 [Gammaproteobacteria bacterium]|jgi:hypothetical protein
MGVCRELAIDRRKAAPVCVACQQVEINVDRIIRLSRHDWGAVRRLAVAVVAAVVLSACSADEESTESATPEKTEHVWKDKTEAIDKARDVGRLIGAAAARQDEAVKKATQ